MRRKRTSPDDWQSVQVVVNDPGGLWPNSNWWLNPTTRAEIVFALLDSGELVSVLFDTTNDKRALKPVNTKANRDRWQRIAPQGTSRIHPRRYWAFFRKLPTQRQVRRAQEKESRERLLPNAVKRKEVPVPEASRSVAGGWEDDALEAALADAHVPTLVNALVHLTGDASLIRGDIRPTSQLFGDPQGGISADDQAAIRERAFEALKAHRDAGFPPLPEPSAALVKEMVDFIIGVELDASYGEFLMSELKIFDEDPYGVSFDDVPAETRRKFHVVVVGAGMSGLLAAIRLKQAGIGYTVVEKNSDVGGTWFENRYPGCRVDSPNHTYSYSFAPNDWPNHFSPQQVLLDYFNRIADEHGIRDNIRFSTELIEARYAEDGTWQVEVRGPDGEERLTANAVISAVGQLNRPKLPAIEGRDSFRGPAFHTARWEAEHDLAGKRIAVIGTGASAFQTVPEIARTAEQVTVFQRTPPWVAPRAEYHEAIPDAKHWLLNNVPFYAKWYRFWMFWTTAEGLLGMVRRDPAWNEERSVSEANDQLRAMLTANVQQMVGDDPDLFAKCVPNYPPAGKRMLVDNGHWFNALKRENVELVTDPIARINAGGIETESGRQVDADVIIYGTGFHASRILFPMRIHGKGGVELRERWGADPRAYLGIVMPGYPNLFCCYGPNTNIVVNGSIIFFSECEVRYIMGCLRLLMTRGDRAMDCLPAVHDAYNEKIDAGNEGMAWGAENVSSWYKNEHGRVTQNWPGTLLEFWQQSKAPEAADFTFT